MYLKNWIMKGTETSFVLSPVKPVEKNDITVMYYALDSLVRVILHKY